MLNVGSSYFLMCDPSIFIFQSQAESNKAIKNNGHYNS